MTGTLTIPVRAVPITTRKSWTPWPHPSPRLLGHATITFSGGWTIQDVPVFRCSDGSLSVGVPSAAEVGPDDLIRTDPTGRKQYRRIVSFESGAVWQHWTPLVLSALAAAGLAPAAGEAQP